MKITAAFNCAVADFLATLPNDSFLVMAGLDPAIHALC
jgi:hypothetical protein